MFLVAATELAHAHTGSVVEVGGDEGRHAVSVVRIAPGERVLLCDGAGRRAEVAVVDVSPGRFSAEVLALCEVPEPSPRFVLVQALAKGDRDEQAVEAATELGVDEVVPWQAARSIVRWRGDTKEDRGRRRWQSIVGAATKQSRRSHTPLVGPVQSTGELVERVAAHGLTLVLHEEATRPLADVAPPDDGEILVVVGPEGGIAPEELAALTAAGAVAVRLGDEVLRSSTAGPAALAVLSAASRWR